GGCVGLCTDAVPGADLHSRLDAACGRWVAAPALQRLPGSGIVSFTFLAGTRWQSRLPRTTCLRGCARWAAGRAAAMAPAGALRLAWSQGGTLPLSALKAGRPEWQWFPRPVHRYTKPGESASGR